jgi:uncharacterized protein
MEQKPTPKLELHPQPAQVSRLVPQEPLPPYTFVPGRAPHPVSDPAGHRFGLNPPVPDKLDPDHWETNKAYLFGLDLFNAGYFWESHEQWESLWHAAGRSGMVADFLKGLIKLAAAGVKHLEGNPRGVKSHACRAAELWQAVAASLGECKETFLGFRVEPLVELVMTICRQGWPTHEIVLVPSVDQK